MWDTPFEESMLDGKVIIHCPDESLADELIDILEAHGIRWGSGTPLVDDTEWGNYREETCYWVKDKGLSYGSRNHAAEYFQRRYRGYTTCTFYGIKNPDFEVATDDEICSLFNS